MATYTKEEFIAMGYDEATAEALTKPEGGVGGGFPFKKLSMNYSDILTDEAGVKKGNFVAGWKEDKKTLSVKEEGIDLGRELEVIFLSEVYQVSCFDTVTNSNIFQTALYSDPYTTKSQKDKKSGITVEAWKASGKKATFDQIMLVVAKKPSDTEWAPYLMYLHGTNYHQWRTQLEDLDLVEGIRVQYKFTLAPKKVATDYQPAWCYEIKAHEKRDGNSIMETVKVTADALKEFNRWVEQSNSRGSSDANIASTPTTKASDIEVDEDDIAF